MDTLTGAAPPEATPTVARPPAGVELEPMPTPTRGAGLDTTGVLATVAPTSPPLAPPAAEPTVDPVAVPTPTEATLAAGCAPPTATAARGGLDPDAGATEAEAVRALLATPTVATRPWVLERSAAEAATRGCPDPTTLTVRPATLAWATLRGVKLPDTAKGLRDPLATLAVATRPWGRERLAAEAATSGLPLGPTVTR
jgi:hypothetical protein